MDVSAERRAGAEVIVTTRVPAGATRSVEFRTPTATAEISSTNGDFRDEENRCHCRSDCRDVRRNRCLVEFHSRQAGSGSSRKGSGRGRPANYRSSRHHAKTRHKPSCRGLALHKLTLLGRPAASVGTRISTIFVSLHRTPTFWLRRDRTRRARRPWQTWRIPQRASTENITQIRLTLGSSCGPHLSRLD
jgi:hypothetical protein